MNDCDAIRVMSANKLYDILSAECDRYLRLVDSPKEARCLNELDQAAKMICELGKMLI